MSNENTATFVRKLSGFTGDARLYKVDPPMPGWDADEPEAHAHVIVSAVNVAFGGGPETYIFPATDEGEIADWGELPGSFKGDLDHAAALANAGYAIV